MAASTSSERQPLLRHGDVQESSDRDLALSVFIKDFSAILVSEDVHAALRFLNASAPHRFTGIYRFEGEVVHNILLFDRKNPHLLVGDDVPRRESYCSLAARDGFFATSDTAEDARREGGRRRDSAVLSYCGVLLRDAQGEPAGTLCHFDLQARHDPAQALAILRAVCETVQNVFRAGLFGTSDGADR